MLRILPLLLFLAAANVAASSLCKRIVNGTTEYYNAATCGGDKSLGTIQHGTQDNARVAAELQGYQDELDRTARSMAYQRVAPPPAAVPIPPAEPQIQRVTPKTGIVVDGSGRAYSRIGPGMVSDMKTGKPCPVVGGTVFCN